MSKKKIFVIFAVAATFIGVVLFALSGKVHYVDNQPAIAFADKFYGELQQAHIDEALQSYGANYVSQKDENWKRLLVGLNSSYGTITSRSLVGASVVPVEEVGCSLLRYDVRRGQLATEEKLIVCPKDKQSGYLIAGHELRRTDTGQSIIAGLSVQESGVRVP